MELFLDFNLPRKVTNVVRPHRVFFVPWKHALKQRSVGFLFRCLFCIQASLAL